MANDLSAIMPKILARGLLALREQAVMPRLVNGSYAAEAAQKGDTIDVPIPSAQTASDVTPGSTPPTPADITPGKVQVALDNWKKTNFHLTDREMAEVERNEHFLPMQTSEAIRALANEVNASIHAEYVGVYGLVGTAGTTPFASDAAAAIDARKTLHAQRAPKQNRRGVVDFDTEANALGLATFADAEKTGESTVKIEGEVGRKYGIDWFSDDNVASHAAGSLVDNVTVTGANAAGTKTVNLSTDAGGSFDLVKGDVIAFAGDSQTYVVTAATGTVGGSSAGDVAIDPGLQVATGGGEAVSLTAGHVVNLAFHRDAFAFANRPLAQSTQDLGLGSRILSMTDPQTGISLRLEVSRQYKQVMWEFDLLWGVKLVRPELACRIAG